MRVTSSLWVSACIRRAQAQGAFATVIKKGAEEAGAIFLVIDDLAGNTTLFGPAPQLDYGESGTSERKFECLLELVSSLEVREKLDRERGFDPDIWILEIEDKLGRSFI